MGPKQSEFTVTESEAGQTLAAVLRGRLQLSWGAARALCESGKVFVSARRWLDSSARLRGGEAVAVRPASPAPLDERQLRAENVLVYEDSQAVVVDKPAGIQSVPYERDDTGTAMDLVRDAWRLKGRAATETPLHIVHRLDKDSSGLLLFAKTRAAERSLQALWREHDIERRYVCVAHGKVTGGRIESYLVPDRGDGLRGTLRSQGDPTFQGKRAVSHVTVLKELAGATLCEVQLETGKTHQIRIHLAESGHPLLGERVYNRDFLRRGGVELSSPRLLLHAHTLGFVHPMTGEKVALRSELPADFRKQLEPLRHRQRDE